MELRRGFEGIRPFLPPRPPLWLWHQRLDFFIQVRPAVHLLPGANRDALPRQLHPCFLKYSPVMSLTPSTGAGSQSSRRAAGRPEVPEYKIQSAEGLSRLQI